MSRVLISTKGLSRNDWVEMRTSYIGGSDISKILGLNRWGTPYSVYMEKTGQVPDKGENEAMYWGNVLEEIVAQEFSKRTGWKVRRNNRILQHDNLDWACANIDREIVNTGEGLECKTTRSYWSDEWEGEEVPQEYICQCQWYMAVTGKKMWWIAVLIDGNRFIYKPINRDEEFITVLLEKAKDFWENNVLAKVPPEIGPEESTTDILKKRYPTSQTVTIDLPDTVAGWFEKRKQADEYIKTWEETKNSVDNNLKALLGDAERGLYKDHIVNWKTINSSRVDTKSLKENYPDVATQVMKESSYRKFEIKVKKEDKK